VHTAFEQVFYRNVWNFQLHKFKIKFFFQLLQFLGNAQVFKCPLAILGSSLPKIFVLKRRWKQQHPIEVFAYNQIYKNSLRPGYN